MHNVRFYMSNNTNDPDLKSKQPLDIGITGLHI